MHPVISYYISFHFLNADYNLLNDFPQTWVSRTVYQAVS